MLFKALFLTVFTVGNLFAAVNPNLPPPYNTVDPLPLNEGPNWYLNAPYVEEVIKKKNAKVVIELGSWLGRSTIHIAQQLPQDGVVYAVDHWYQPPFNRDIPHYYAGHDIKNLYRQFLSNMIHKGLTHKVIPIVNDTVGGLQDLITLKVVPDVIYVDACHEEECVYRDLQGYFPLVKGHGVICGDDWGWNLIHAPVPPICSAVTRFAQENNLMIEVRNGWFWALYEQ